MRTAGVRASVSSNPIFGVGGSFYFERLIPVNTVLAGNAMPGRGPAAKDERRRNIAPNDAARLYLGKIIFQTLTEPSGAGQPAGVDVTKRREHSVRRERRYHGVQNVLLDFHLHVRPGQAADDVIRFAAPVLGEIFLNSFR